MGDLNVRFCNNNEGTQKHMQNTEIKQKTSMEEGGRPMCKKRLNKDNDIHKYTWEVSTKNEKSMIHHSIQRALGNDWKCESQKTG